ncbi:MAG TPA: hypothetical protein ENL39_06360 [Candidatus Aerophobetes bacterium]|uniref:Uncharacterized protein n=1 Tax=Aerophobetes bacterium TaxID=2030807 RepID=A0A7V5I0M7_UNCAE|nr:hypothetical protein [Candidatus Aerophobetes bacterium]
MAKIDLYKVWQKDGYTLVTHTDPIFFTDRLVRNQKISRRRESLEIILNVEKIENYLWEVAENSPYLDVVEEDGSLKIAPRKKISPEFEKNLLCAFRDTFFQEENITNQYLLYQDLFLYYGRYRFGGFYGIIHKLFPLVFIMRVVKGYQPMVWQMLIVDPYFLNKTKEKIISWYEEIEEGAEYAFSNITLVQKENLALKVLNNIVRKNKGKEGFNIASKLCGRLGLGFLKDFYWVATQATEDTEWDIYKKPPVPFTLWPERKSE